MKPRLLDLFCCAGGAGMGYARAGFEITGVDVVRHANNPHAVMETDALALDPGWIAANFDAVHASPPCQGYTTMRHAPGAKGAPRLIGQTRELLQATGLPWVIENVEAAAPEMRNPLLLCGTMFGLGAQGHELQRHRLFETSFPVLPLACQHTERPVIGVYGGHARNRAAKHGGRGTKDTWDGGHKAAASEALGIDWMNLAEMSEAIPPAYTEYLGWQLRAVLMVRTVAALYVEPEGCYVGVPGVDPWDEARDARTYAGPHPVVAHPPCQRWGRFWHGSTRRPHQYRLGEDGGCFAAALTAVRNYGGVLEHPADSHAWSYFGLRLPKRGEGWVQADGYGCMTCYVEQGHYGHASRKPTWLLAKAPNLPELDWSRGEQRLPEWMVERYGYKKARRIGVVAMVGGKDKTAIRNATPEPFRDLLLSIARKAHNVISTSR